MQKKVERFKRMIMEVTDLGHAEAVLGWDQQVYMPRGGGEDRGDILETIASLASEVHLQRDGRTAGRTETLRRNIGRGFR